MKQTWKIDFNLKLFLCSLTKKLRYNVFHEFYENSHRYFVEYEEYPGGSPGLPFLPQQGIPEKALS